MGSQARVPGSFRDPSGFLYHHEGVLYRQVNKSYREHYDHLIESGLLERLIDEKLLVPHEEVSTAPADPDHAYKVIRPKQLGFVSYPYEWCFSQLQDAAATTIRIQKIALDHGMTLKDASAYNIQFIGSAPIMIDTLSFETYQEGEPWVAYRQFCQHFLAPLALMSYSDVRLAQLLRAYIDGVPLNLASKLLPLRSRFRFGLLTHLHVHAKAQKRYAGKALKTTRHKMPRMSLLGLISSLESTVSRLRWKTPKTEWGDYYEDTNYSRQSMENKKSVIAKFVEEIRPNVAWDMGANTGEFSRIVAGTAETTIAFDIDPVAVERGYRDNRTGNSAVLPLLMDLTNPSPSLGWDHAERMSLAARGPADCVLALALVHHLAITNNVPLPTLATFFARLGRHLVIEFVPKEDSQVQRLLATRQDIFEDYHQQAFESAFAERFQIREQVAVEGSSRTLYLMSNLSR